LTPNLTPVPAYDSDVGTRRANSEGNIYQRADGRWEARISYTDNLTGQRKRTSVYGPSQKDVRAEFKKVRDRLASHAPAKDAKMPVGEWMAQWRTISLAVSKRAVSTRSLYATLSKKHLEPQQHVADDGAILGHLVHDDAAQFRGPRNRAEPQPDAVAS